MALLERNSVSCMYMPMHSNRTISNISDNGRTPTAQEIGMKCSNQVAKETLDLVDNSSLCIDIRYQFRFCSLSYIRH